MEVVPLRLAGLKLIRPRVFGDERGYFYESYRAPLYQEFPPFVQDNISFSVKNTVRALHYQSAPGQAKLVSCLQGKIFDVVVDLRRDSPTFGQWEAVELEGATQLFVPIGFAHGFCVLSDHALVQYKVSAVYNPATECSIRWNDPTFNISWPVQEPILSPRDQVSPFFSKADV
ncbi:MAG: dTDP-4-dehydrorhamnose 3,5-epimerase [Verrucomicrobiota bacterium]|nr:dTDP-4-dehydrorhamnose 3,5-epimerase [Verrucomicrobiota bacterium]